MTQATISDILAHIKYRWAAVVGLGLCVALLGGWCPGDECAQGMLLSIPWAGWGAAFYALCLIAPRSWIMPLAAAGLVVHACLARIMVNEHAFCVACLFAVAVTAYLFLAGAREHSARRVGSGGLLILCATVGIFLWPLPQTIKSSPGVPVGSVPYQTASAEAVRPVEQPAEQPTTQPAEQPAGQVVQQPVGRNTAPAATIPSIEVTAPDGTLVRLDPATRPILLFAPWCEHCLEPLKAVAQLPSERRPYLVAVFWEGEAQETEAKLRQAGLDGAIYYTSAMEPESVPRLLTETGEIRGESQVCAYLQQMR